MYNMFVPPQVTCYDWDADGSHDLIGHFTTSLGEMTDAYHNHKKVWSIPLAGSSDGT